MKSLTMQPTDIKRILQIKNEEEFELVIKAYRFLFDILCYLKEGGNITTGIVTWTKYSDSEVIATDNESNVIFKTSVDFKSDIMFEELSDAISKASEIVIPV